MYRYSRPQAGRYREHRQFGIEVFGEAEPARRRRGDRGRRRVPPGARAVALPSVEVNSIGDETCRPAYREALIAYLRGAPGRAPRRAQGPVPRTTRCGCSTARTRPAGRVAAEAPRIADHLCDACREHFDGVLGGPRARPGSTPVVTPTLVRGLDYYTRTAFEFVDALQGLSRRSRRPCSAAAGTTGWPRRSAGRTCPGVGFGMGLERVLLALEDEGARAARGAGARRVRRRVSATTAARGRREPRAELRARGIAGRRRLRGPAAEGAAQDGRPGRRRLRGDHRRARARRRRRSTLRRLADGVAGDACRSPEWSHWLVRGRRGTVGESSDLRDRDAHARVRRAARRARRRATSRSAAGWRTGGTTAASRSSTCATARASSRSCSIPRRRPRRTRRGAGDPAPSGWCA